MAQKVVKPWVKFVSKFGIVAAIIAVLYYTASISGVLPSSDDSSKSSLFGSGDKDVIVLSTNTFIGFADWVYMNNGLEPNEDCILYKDYGLKLKILIQDDFEACRRGLMNGDTHIVYGTLDAYPVEMGEGSEMSDTKFFNISNWSVGADAIVCNSRINTVNDMVGKVICCSKGTASHTLLLNTLEASGLGPDMVNDGAETLSNKINIKYCESGIEAAKIFRAGQCDGAVVYSPDDEDLVENIKGSKVLVSTKQASNIICDGLTAKKDWLEKNKDKVKKLIACQLFVHSEINNNQEVAKKAAKIFSENYDYTYDLALQSLSKVRFVTLEDEKNFFGLNSEFTGMTGSELYSKMARTYAKLNIVKSPLSWNKVSDISIIEELSADGNIKGDQKAQEEKSFSAPTKELETAKEMSTKKLVIEFAIGSSTLDNNAKSLIDREFVSIAKEFAGSRIRIEGNTDGTGSNAINGPLSKARAQAVADYLINEYGFDKNRFIVIGNGSSKARLAGIHESRYFRTTDFMLINE